MSEILNEEKPLPYFFDVLNYNEITDEELIKHINRVGIVLLEKDKTVKTIFG